MKFATAALIGLAQANYSYYTGSQSTWYSSSLNSDSYPARGVAGTSYDYTYRNSYSYDATNSAIYKWDYAYDAWNSTRAYYTGGDSTWYSGTLQSDGYGYTSYDYTYRNSYSYDSTYSKVYKWDYAYDHWNHTNGALTNMHSYNS